MRKIVTTKQSLIMAAFVIVGLTAVTTCAQTENQSTKSRVTETFIFPNDCTSELMDVTSTSTVNCHDQLRADGSFDEKCEIRQDVTAVGQISGNTFHGSATFKDEFVAPDACNFRFTNRGRVHLISPGSDVNAVITFDDIIIMQDCVLLPDQHFVSFDCRGSNS